MIEPATKAVKVWGREGSPDQNIFGHTTGVHQKCLEYGCGGRRVWVKWPDGHTTRPCQKDLIPQEDGSYRVI